MRALVACVVLLGCERAPPAPAPVPVPVAPRLIDWQLGGLGVWKGGTVGGLLWHVRIDLTAAHMSITDPGARTAERTLTPDRVRDYAKLALAARDEKHAAPSHACSDVSETLTIDTVTITS